MSENFNGPFVFVEYVDGDEPNLTHLESFECLRAHIQSECGVFQHDWDISLEESISYLKDHCAIFCMMKGGFDVFDLEIVEKEIMVPKAIKTLSIQKRS